MPLRSIFMDSPVSPPPNKMLTINCMMVFFILATAYTGMLTSLITKPREPNFIRNLDELVRQTKIRWMIEHGSALSNYGKTAEEGSALR